MLSVFRNMFRIRDLRNKILFTLFIFAIYRLGAAIPVPGVDLDRVRRLHRGSRAVRVPRHPQPLFRRRA